MEVTIMQSFKDLASAASEKTTTTTLIRLRSIICPGWIHACYIKSVKLYVYFRPALVHMHNKQIHKVWTSIRSELTEKIQLLVWQFWHRCDLEIRSGCTPETCQLFPLNTMWKSQHAFWAWPCPMHITTVQTGNSAGSEPMEKIRPSVWQFQHDCGLEIRSRLLKLLKPKGGHDHALLKRCHSEMRKHKC